MKIGTMVSLNENVAEKIRDVKKIRSAILSACVLEYGDVYG